MNQETVDWLKWLNDQIWVYHPPQYRSGYKSSYGHYSTVRPLTTEECIKFIVICDKHRSDLVFEPGSGVFGFGVALNLYLPPLYPGTPIRHLISVTCGDHIYPGDKGVDNKLHYRFVEQFTHTTQNRKMREFCGVKEPLHSMAYYDY